MRIVTLRRAMCGIFVALCNCVMDIKPPPTPTFDAPKRPVMRPSGFVIPRGDIVLSQRRRPIVPRPRVTIASPGLRPGAAALRIEAARSALETLTQARAEAALDDVLRRTLTEVTALMEERGLR